MRPRAALIVAVVAAVLSPGLSAHPRPHPGAVQAPIGPRVDAGRLISDLKTLSSPELAGREAGSEGGRRAAAFILERFRLLGLKPVGGRFDQVFAVPGGSRDPRRRAEGNDRQATGTNLAGLIEGSADRDRVLLVTAHYDHLGVRGGRTYPGADDNASGVAGLLAAASWFARHRPRRSILFVAFDGEELGLQGAKHFVAHPPIDLARVALVVNLDMIGRGDANTLVVAGTHHYPHLKDTVEAAARGRRIRVAFGHDKPSPGNRRDDWTHASDHGPFHDAGIPFLYFGVEDHPDYHQPTDTADRIPAAFYVEAVEVIIETVRRFSERTSEVMP